MTDNFARRLKKQKFSLAIKDDTADFAKKAGFDKKTRKYNKTKSIQIKHSLYWFKMN